MLDGKGRVLTASGAVVLAVGLPALALLKKDWGAFRRGSGKRRPCLCLLVL